MVGADRVLAAGPATNLALVNHPASSVGVIVIDANGRLVATHSLRRPSTLQISIGLRGPPVQVLVEGVAGAAYCEPGAVLGIILP